MTDETRRILDLLASGRLVDRIPEEAEYREELERLLNYVSQISLFAEALSKGDLSKKLNFSGGPVAGSLMALQASLRHLTWQTQMIAEGDLSQRVDFMGEFSAAFNTMVEKLKITYTDLTYISVHDGLTGLYNRLYFNTELDRLKKSRRFPASIMVADVDGLKDLNDSMGHLVGDKLIQKAALLLTTVFRSEDVVARIGGDEFGIIMRGVNDLKAEEIRARVLASQEEMNKENDDLRLSISIGAATALCGEEVDETLKKADELMYIHKAEHKTK